MRDPDAALVSFVFLSCIGLILGAVIYAVFAFPRVRRAPYRLFGAMPRAGIVCGGGTSLAIVAAAWYSHFAEFYRVEVRSGTMILYYELPARNVVLPLREIAGMRRGMTLDKYSSWRVDVVAGRRIYHGANMNRTQLDSAWAALAPFVNPLI